MDRFATILDEVATAAATLVAADLPTLRRPSAVPPRTIVGQTFVRQRGFVVYVLRQNGFRFREIGAYVLLTPVHTIMVYRRVELEPIVYHFDEGQLAAYRRLVDECNKGTRMEEVSMARPLSCAASVPAINGKAIEQQLGVVESKVKKIISYINQETKVTRSTVGQLQTDVNKMHKDYEFFKLTS